jgi:predicted permease
MTIHSLFQDLHYSLRQLRRAPGFALTAIAILALGLGANMAVFTVLNGVLLHPLPYADANRLAVVQLDSSQFEPGSYFNMNYANMLQLRDAIGGQIQIGAAFIEIPVSIVGSGGRLQVERSSIEASLLRLLGVQPILGRTFLDEESQPGHEHVVVLGEDTWRRLYNSDRSIIGKTLTIRSETYTIVGVMPRSFSFPFGDEKQIWTPEPLDAAARTSMDGKYAVGGKMYLRIPVSMTAAQLEADLNRVQPVISKQNPSGYTPTAVKVTRYQESLNEQARKPLLLLYCVVFGIWLLACLNVASLRLTRAVSRTREQAVRTALGASRVRLLQQALAESLLLSGTGAVAGLLLALTAIKLLRHSIDRLVPMSSAIHLDWRVLIAMTALTLVTAAICALFPAFGAMRRNVRSGLQGMTTTATARQNRTREALVIAQLGLTLVFLSGAGLFLRTIYALRQVPLGFTQQNVLTGGIILNGSSHQKDEEGKNSNANIVRTSYLPLIERLKAIPGVQVAALSSVLPLRANFAVSIITNIDHKDVPFKQQPQADGRLASAGLVEALGVPMISGRFFTEDDSASAPPVAVVNQAFVNKYLPGQNAVGHVISMGKTGRFHDIRIVGVIGDVKQARVTEPTKPEIYFCLAQIEPGTPLYGIATAFIQVAIRAAVPAGTLRAQFDKALHEIAPDATTIDVKTIHEAVEDSFGSQTLIARLLEGFAVLALVIASVGLYGLLSFTVAQRAREIGLRIALGAPLANIIKLVLRRAMILVGIGLAMGGTMAWFATQFARTYLFGIHAHDAFNLIAVAMVLVVAALAAAWLPARRAASIDPMQALRSE